MSDRDWYEWHDHYGTPGSTLARRLVVVQDRIRHALDTAPPGRLRVVSLCAGQGRDLLEVLAQHPRRDDVTARLVELDPRNATKAMRTAAAAGLGQVEVVVGDAALTDQYADLVPADLMLACGIFGNVSEADVRNTIAHCRQLCRTGGIVVWTRHREPPDLVPQICQWFGEAGFTLEWLSGKEAGHGGVGVHRYAGEPQPLATAARMFAFVGYDQT